MQKYGFMLPEKNTMGFAGSLSIKKITANGQFYDYGIVARKKVTDVFANYLVDALQSSGSAMHVFRWHACGFSTAAESAADTLLTAETTEVRDYGTSTENATNIWESVATHTFQNASTVGEHAMFDSSGNSTGTMVDRSMFAGIAVSSGDQIQFTYRLTVVSSG